MYIDGDALMTRYGPAFNTFVYQSGIEVVIRTDIIPFTFPGGKYNDFLDYDHWLQKHPFNFPGPFYTGESDTCGTGHGEAPDNVLYDEYCCEYIFKQPQSFSELFCVMNAAAIEVFSSYSCNGNSYWTYQTCREWWSNRQELLHTLNTPKFKKMNGERVQLYVDYLDGNAKIDLQKYCYFLENGIYPTDAIYKLPEL